MRFKIFGTEIYLSFLFLGLITIMLATDKTGFMLPTIFAVVMHETAHLFAMWLLDCSPKRIKLIPASVQISTSFSKGYKNDILVSLSGPVINLVLFGTLYYNYLCFENQATINFALINLVFGIFNLLPVKGLDGGTVLLSILCKFMNIDRAVLIVRASTAIIASAIIMLAIMLTVGGKMNLSLYIIGIYLFIMCLMKM